jgi:signal transduction histidine kinase
VQFRTPFRVPGDAESSLSRGLPNTDASNVTWSELRLPAVQIHLGDSVRLRYALFLLAWGLVSLYWLSWHALPFQVAIAAAALWHAVRRERLLESAEGVELQNERLRQLDRLKDEFIALVSHELRTPLTSIRGYLELMGDDPSLSDENTTFLETIDRNAQRLQRVVGDLLFCAQIEAGKLSLEHGLVDLDALVAEAVTAAQPAARSKELALTATPGAIGEVPGDRARLAQVVDNFISNAVKFTPHGGSVKLAVRVVGNEAELSIADTGVGISSTELPRLFERFFRTERATADAIPGTGLGLAIARAIVEEHGGRVTVESEAGAGTTFCFYLPRS